MADHDQSEGELESNQQQQFTLEELDGWSKKQMQNWLYKQGLKKSGNKTVLANRIIRAINFGDSDLSGSSSDEENSTSDLPNVNKLSNWNLLSTTNCPPLRHEDVENYFLFEKNPVTGKTKQCNRQLKKSNKFCNENYVAEMEYNSVDNASPYCVIRTKCKPSMRQKVSVSGGYVRTHYTLSVTITKQTGKIITGTCDCKAGLSGVCSHVGGLLLTAVKVKNSCTSTGCKWLAPNTKLTKPPSPKRLGEIKFSAESSRELPVKPFPDVYQAGPCKDPDIFLKEIMEGLAVTNPTCVLFQTMCEKSANIDDILSAYSPPYMFSDTQNLSSSVCQTAFREFVNKLSISDEEIKRVNIATRGQSNNKNWRIIRSNLITASNFGMVCRRQVTTSPDNLIKQMRGYNTIPDNIPSIQHGRRFENTASRAYVKNHINTCNGHVEVKDTGVMISEQYPFLGASVDGLIVCSVCGTGALEIKCPYGRKGDKWRQKLPQECAKNSSFCCEINQSSNELQLKTKHHYYYQVMGQMAVLGVRWADFVIWTKKGLCIERITFQEDFWQQQMLFKLKDFYTHDFVAELFSERIRRGLPLFGDD